MNRNFFWVDGGGEGPGTPRWDPRAKRGGSTPGGGGGLTTPLDPPTGAESPRPRAVAKRPDATRQHAAR